MEIVLDKSFLYRSGSQKISHLCFSNQVLMPEALFYELLTTSSENRAKCFRNLPAADNPVMLIKNVGYILRTEVKNKMPFTDIKDASHNIRYIFNNKLIDPNHEFTCEQKNTISTWRADIHSRIEDFKQKAAVVSGWFPAVKHFKAGSNREPIEKAKLLLCKDHSVVKSIYEQIRHQSFPETDLIDERWALFREIQVQVIAALDYVGKYGDNNPLIVSKKIENEYMDLEYCITALMVGALASYDKGMIQRFLSILPEGKVIN